MTEGEARDTLHRGGRAEAIVRIVEGAWSEHVNEQRLRSSRARASVVWDYMARLADEHLASLAGVRRVELSGGLPVYVCDDQLVVRFKKLDRMLAPRNIPTQQQRMISQQLGIEGIPPLGYVSCGYVLDRAQADIERVMAVKHVRRRREWHIDLRELAEGQLEPVTPILPIEPTAPAAEARPLPRIVPPAIETEGEDA